MTFTIVLSGAMTITSIRDIYSKAINPSGIMIYIISQKRISTQPNATCWH